jgi:hypothetical protein
MISPRDSRDLRPLQPLMLRPVSAYLDPARDMYDILCGANPYDPSTMTHLYVHPDLVYARHDGSSIGEFRKPYKKVSLLI